MHDSLHIEYASSLSDLGYPFTNLSVPHLAFNEMPILIVTRYIDGHLIFQNKVEGDEAMKLYTKLLSNKIKNFEEKSNGRDT